MELGDADDVIFKRSNSKQGDGVVGILTGGLIDRTGVAPIYERWRRDPPAALSALLCAEYYVPAVVLALVPFLNSELYHLRS
jgi:non-canonical (house-cleaning) NTP pyrophosphatase